MVGGRAESGYGAVGYLFDEAAPQYPASCGATLIAPDVAVTAAHCVWHAATLGYTVGFGRIGDGADGGAGEAGARDAGASVVTRRRVIEAIAHPKFTWGSSVDWNDASSWFDVAILRLESPVTDRTPARIAPAATTCAHRYVGYGRVTEGNSWVTDGYTGERKSTQICVDGQSANEVLVHGVGGGNCWADSGGALMQEGKNLIVGVLSRFAPLADFNYTCKNGDVMIMTQLAPHFADFISRYAPNALASLPPAGRAVNRCVLQSPATLGAVAFSTSPPITARVRVDGVTSWRGAGSRVRGELGVAATGTALPGPGWSWYRASYARDVDDARRGDRLADEHTATFMPFTTGSYDIAFRFTADDGRTWKYCDRAPDAGADAGGP